MRKPDRGKVVRLEDLPNVGKAVAADLRRINITRPQDLAGEDPLKLFRKLQEVTGTRQDPCMLDTFMAVIHFMDSGEALPWWKFTKKRKQQYQLLLEKQ